MSLTDGVHLLEAITGLIVALAWPSLVGVVIYKFRNELTALLKGIHAVELPLFGGAKAVVKVELDKAAAEASSTLSSRPSEVESSRADTVAELVNQDVVLIRQQVDALALEYDDIRGSMPPSVRRTSEMEKVVAKMRTIGKAAYTIRWELTASPSPGHRMQAVACLQMRSDYEMLDWLAQRFQAERSFIGYHAIIAMIVAAEAATRSKDSAQYAWGVKTAYEKVRESSQALLADRPGTKSKLDDLDKVVRSLTTIGAQRSEAAE